MYSLLIANIPHDCQPVEIQDWIETFGVQVLNLKLISDVVSLSSPAFARVQLTNAHDTVKAARLLDGQPLKRRFLRVKALKLIDTAKPVSPLKASA